MYPHLPKRVLAGKDRPSELPGVAREALALASKLGMAEEISDPDDDSDKSDGEVPGVT